MSDYNKREIEEIENEISELLIKESTERIDIGVI